jgi:hypothetical protein
MANELTPEHMTLIAAENALRRGRQLLETLTTTLIGVNHEPPSGSHIMQVLTEMRAAQKTVSDAMLKTVKQP